ncbi:MAG TPA: hypothetical protein VME69_03580 [Methylocella sp.]|nr:hypothetical protein [Methylocella sp.]
MADFFGSILGKLVGFIAYISGLLPIIMHNLILILFVAAVLWGLFRLVQNGWRKWRGQGEPEDGT